MNLIPVILASVMLVAGIYSVFAIYGRLVALEDSEQLLAQKVEAHNNEIHLLTVELELAKAKAHTHSVVAGIEDTTAIAVDVSIGLEAELARIQTLIRKLHKLREGPYAYNKNLPAGRRPPRLRL